MEMGEKVFIAGFVISAILAYFFMSADIIGIFAGGIGGAIPIWVIFYAIPSKLKKIINKHKLKENE